MYSPTEYIKLICNVVLSFPMSVLAIAQGYGKLRHIQ